VQTPSIFSVHHFVPLLTRLGIFLEQLQLALLPRGASHLQPYALVAVIEVHKPKLLSFGLHFTPATYRRTDFRRPVQDSVCCWSLPHKYQHAACVWPMWGAGMSIWHDHVHANNSWLAGEKWSGNPRRPHKTSAALQFLATVTWYSGLY
jgi:hypothetical protein